ncbi:2-amino-4-hydroxy-6-hydroxymethyldihydropteridine pyrophosphokinase [Mariprofundus micogutta]|uniref:2-amino-4-hydroxy-6-hydroxymethyldihydropteridine pyrophosphokinase n=1 Tax=Mariprofundus micogutta TaxID=1921010 RepID=A0A1L8CML0_9PROT|nr:2-amino-4-hydroxy-6-hydroxymethyldihydropteridine diphosphokinase [Mariprofundus micogutta]GAV20160.1 2-amino-4-hydroxy-6-hydroxymethyldihydropteridine pyrophosphokinase [Mariprofundus micogutta]
MASVLVGLGSNIYPESNLQQAAVALGQAFEDVVFSSVYRSAAVGMQGGDFLNACCMISTGLTLPQVKIKLKQLEDLQGRDRSEGSWKPRTVDLDVLMYDDDVVDEELYRYAHAFVPAAELVSINLPEDTEGLVTVVSLRL